MGFGAGMGEGADEVDTVLPTAISSGWGGLFLSNAKSKAKYEGRKKFEHLKFLNFLKAEDILDT